VVSLMLRVLNIANAVLLAAACVFIFMKASNAGVHLTVTQVRSRAGKGAGSSTWRGTPVAACLRSQYYGFRGRCCSVAPSHGTPYEPSLFESPVLTLARQQSLSHEHVAPSRTARGAGGYHCARHIARRGMGVRATRILLLRGLRHRRRGRILAPLQLIAEHARLANFYSHQGPSGLTLVVGSQLAARTPARVAYSGGSPNSPRMAANTLPACMRSCGCGVQGGWSL
jgi:hypothetical protein